MNFFKILLVLSVVCWVLTMGSALFGFALIRMGSAVISQAIFWVFFVMSTAFFIIGYGGLGLLSEDERR